jgi:RimJ/RimL family protein N-acetyltransferase
METITIRELEPSDGRMVEFAFGHLSERSRFLRFFGSKPQLSPRDMSRLLSVDHWHHEALIAFSPPPRAPIAIARYVRLEDDFEAAEVAITVVDGWQRRGVGSALLAALTARARSAGIRRFHMSMLRENVGARALARKVAAANGPATMTAAGSVVELSYWICRRRLTAAPYSLSGASLDPAGSSDPDGSPPPSPPSAPTPTGVGCGAGSITVSLTSASDAVLGSPSSPAGQSTITVEPDGTCERRTKSASGSSM